MPLTIKANGFYFRLTPKPDSDHVMTVEGHGYLIECSGYRGAVEWVREIAGCAL